MTFSTNQVAEAAQVSLRQLQWWHERKLVEPVIDNHSRVYDDEDLFKALLIGRMRKKAISLQRVKTILKTIPLEKLRTQQDAVLLIRPEPYRGMRISTDESALCQADLENTPFIVVRIAPLLFILQKEMRKKALQ